MIVYYLSISVVIKGYDSETGQYTATLTFDATQVDDFGFYECLTEDQNKVIKSFQMYINSTKHLLLPIPQEVSPLIIVNAGKTAHVPCRLLNPTISEEIDLKLIRPVLLLSLMFVWNYQVTYLLGFWFAFRVEDQKSVQNFNWLLN